MPKGDICSIQDCENITRFGDICDKHVWRMKKFKSYDLPSKDIVKTCRAPGCDKPVDKKQASRLCVMHRVRWSRHKSFDLPEKPKLPEGIFKICEKHGELKEEQTYKVPKREWLNCKLCKDEALAKFEERNPGRDTNKNRNYMFVGSKHKIRVEVSLYNKLHEEQKGLCAICLKPETMTASKKKVPKRLAVDHCHERLIVRGLLCQKCNVALGALDDSIEMLQSAIAYLEKYTKEK